MKKDSTCCKCKQAISGFVAHKDTTGSWCEDCMNLYTCENCGSLEDKILDGGLCDFCEAEHGE